MAERSRLPLRTTPGPSRAATTLRSSGRASSSCTTASVDSVAAPSSAKARRASDLPAPSPPVSPTNGTPTGYSSCGSEASSGAGSPRSGGRSYRGLAVSVTRGCGLGPGGFRCPRLRSSAPAAGSSGGAPPLGRAPKSEGGAGSPCAHVGRRTRLDRRGRENVASSSPRLGGGAGLGCGLDGASCSSKRLTLSERRRRSGRYQGSSAHVCPGLKDLARVINVRWASRDVPEAFTAVHDLQKGRRSRPS